MKQKITLFFVLIFVSFFGQAQTTLASGDILFTGYDATVTPSASASDSYSFVLLTPISNGTVISFSDRGYTGSGWIAAGPTEGTVTWTSSSALAMGTEILIKGLAASVYDPATTSLVANGTVTRTEGTFLYGLSLSTVGDQIIAFQGGAGSISAGGVTILTGLSYSRCDANSSSATWDSAATCTIGPSTSVKPTGLGANGFYLGANPTNQSSVFTGIGPFANAAAITAAVLNSANWQVSTTALTMPSKAPFIGVLPTIATNPPNRTICVGSSTTFPITANNATSYQWQVNTGSGFTNITNNAIYTNATTATLTITGATAGMSGYLYRCVASGTGSATSNSGTLTVPNTIVTTTSQTNVSCKGGTNGSAVLSASGGIAPYTYLWSPSGGTGSSASGLSAQTYTVTVTDNITCATTHTVIITEPLVALTVTPASQTNISCFGGSNGAAAINTPTGGTAGYTYDWTPGTPTGDGTTSVSGLTAGTWTCTVTDANSCTASQSFTVTQPTALVATAASQTNVSCFGGSNGAAAVNTATGGAGGYTYDWTPGTPTGDGTTSVSGLTAGTWTCTVTDANSCTASQSFTVTQPTAISMTPASQTNIACNGGSDGSAAVDTATGGAGGYTYDWTPGTPTGDGTTSVSGLTAGTWTCTVTDANSCTASQSFMVTQPTAISMTPSSQTNVSCFGGSNGAAAVNTATGGAGGYTYDWTPGTPTGDGTTSITGLTAGTWTCTVTDANSCTASQSFTVTQPTAISMTPASQTNIACNGGSDGSAAVDTATGGAGGYTYDWTPGTPTGDGTTSVSGLTAGTWTCTVTDANSCTASQSFTVTQPTALVATAASQTNISCFGGSNGAAAVNTATGGAGGYTYDWTPGTPTGDGTTSVTGLTAGTWTCTVTDANSCTASQSFTVTQPTAISMTPSSQTNVSCFGGSNGAASVNTPTGGAGGYTYDWTPGTPTGDGTTSVSGLTAGTWTCTVTDANSCTASQSFTVTQPTAISVTPASQTNISCFGGSNGAAAINTPTGGTAGYTYDWTPGTPTGDGTTSITGLTAGTWTCTVTDANSCTASQSFTVTQPTAISMTAASQTNIACNGGSNGAAAVNTATGGAGGYTYDWTPGTPTGDGTTSVSGLTAGTWTCTVTDANGCSATISATITEPTAIDNTIAEVTTGILTANEVGATYQWYECPNTLLTGETNQNFTPTSLGDYKVEITFGACTVESACYTVTTLGTPTFVKTQFTIYPNPTSGLLYIDTNFDGEFLIVNQLGQTIKTFKVYANLENNINVENLADGIYYIKGTNGIQISSQKLIIKK